MATSNQVDFVAQSKIPTYEDKKVLIGEKLTKREEERLEHIHKNKEEQSKLISAQENVEYFVDQFEKEKKLLEESLSECDSMAKNKLVEKFDEMTAKLGKISKFLTESLMFLPSFQVQKANSAIAELQTKIQEKRDQHFPKKKFAFKSKKKGTVAEKPEESKTEALKISEDDVILAECKFIDVKGQQLQMDGNMNQKDVALARLDGCTVNLYGAPSAIHINKLKNCTVFSGPVSGSIFIRECSNCTFVVACQQLRIHTTVDTDFYIHVTSRAIIEDCSSVRFGPYKLTYPSIDEDYKISGLDKKRNSWDDIDDFNWLAADAHSPNWKLIPEDERKTWD